MATITTFPTEILLEIFSYIPLYSDLALVKQTCKLFNAIVQSIPIHYKYYVDHPDQSAYKLIRALLSNPSIGERLVEIEMEWCRRSGKDLKDPERRRWWTPRWEWTPEEIEKIEGVSAKWKLTARTIKAIVAGANSEALLPLLLCFTVNLNSLDMGDFNPWVVSHVSVGDMEAVFEVFGKFTRIDGDEDYDDETIFDNCVDELEKNIQNDEHWPDLIPTPAYTGWFHENLNGPSDWLPGLASLRHFVHGWERVCYVQYLYGMNAQYLWPIFFLPRIESIVLEDCTTVTDCGCNEPIEDLRGGYEGLKSTVKRLELHFSIFNTYEYIAIAQITGSLEYLFLLGGDDKGQEVDWNLVTRTFWENNKDTLTKEETDVDMYDPNEDEEEEQSALYLLL
ncbi:hypothetical protein ABW20_dc0107023 [Dactylellina cionopaga]|nr:hypothetical protein ABW20_dc0107023 [Dactylellina cionopaga]